MPFYEYRCETCGRKTSLFRATIGAAEAAQAELRCEKCSSPQLRRLFSRFATGRAARTEGEELYDFDRLTANLDEEAL